MEAFDRWMRCREEAGARVDEEFKETEPYSAGVDVLTGDATLPNDLHQLLRILGPAARDSAAFFRVPERRARDVAVVGDRVTFPPLPGYEEQGGSQARLFRSRGGTHAAVLVPHWNANPDSYHAICRALAWRGVDTLCLVLPHHGVRAVDARPTANLFVSANLGRTVRLVKQSVIEVMVAAEWLKGLGHSRVSMVGFSLGSCIAALAAAHDPTVHSAVLALTAGDFAEVVWTGRATRHIRAAVEDHITLEELRAAWAIISPQGYVGQLAQRKIGVQVISGQRDAVVLPSITARYVASLVAAGVEVDHLELGCGHYTLGDFPYNVRALLAATAFLRR